MNTDNARNILIHLAPLQGFTDKTYRKVYEKCFGDIEFYYTPYLSIDKLSRVDNLKDIIYSEVDYSFKEKLIPQLLPGNLNELELMLAEVKKKGFQHVNLNLGCPYPMVTNRGRGSALIQKPELVSEMLQFVADNSDLRTSIKVRAGLETADEIFNLLNNIPRNLVDFIIVHPRTARQLYKGNADAGVVKKCIEYYGDVRFIYNGDITSLTIFNEKLVELNGLCEFMIGRGILQNPFLVWQIKNESADLPDDYLQRLADFCLQLIIEIESDSNDNGHALNRIHNQIGYLLDGFPELKQLRKKIKKGKDIGQIKFELSKI